MLGGLISMSSTSKSSLPWQYSPGCWTQSLWVCVKIKDIMNKLKASQQYKCIHSCHHHQGNEESGDWMVSRESFAARRHYLFLNCFEVAHTWQIVWMAGCVLVSKEDSNFQPIQATWLQSWKRKNDMRGHQWVKLFFMHLWNLRRRKTAQGLPSFTSLLLLTTTTNIMDKKSTKLFWICL